MPEAYRVAHGIATEDVASEPVWWELYDEASKLPYFYNVTTQQTLWERPEGVEVLTIKERDKKDKDAKEKKKKPKKTSSSPAPDAGEPSVSLSASSGSTPVPSKAPFSTSVKKKVSTKHKSSAPSAAAIAAVAAVAANDDDPLESADLPKLKAGWVAIFDSASSKHYYHNAALNETTWDRSAAASADADNDAPTVAVAAATTTPTIATTATISTTVTSSGDEHVAFADADDDDNDVDNTHNDDNDRPSHRASNNNNTATTAATTVTNDRTSSSSDDNNAAAAKALTIDAVVTSLENNAVVVDEADGIERAYTKSRNVLSKSTRAALPEGQRETALPTAIADQISSFQLENFAKKYFDHHKKGVFRRQIPIKRMLRWDSDPIPNAMIKTKASHSKEAVAQFKNILRYMGDAAPSATSKVTRSQMWYAQQIIEKAVSMPELRDEIYVQLCKQTNDNPNPQSLSKGWELFVMCAYSFPPTKDFEDWLRQYIEANVKQAGTTGVFASYTLRLLNRTVRLFATMRSKMPSEKELQVQREAPFNPSPFGATLLECMEMQATKAPDAKLPYMLTLLTEGVLNGGGLTTEGIFRVPADPTNALKLKVSLEGGSYDLVCKDVHAIGSVLKLWLRELADPLVPDSLYDECIKIAETPAKCVKLIQSRLPPMERACLLYLCNFLRTMAQHVEKTKMNDANLAMVFAPNVLRCPSTNPQVIYENTKHEVNFLLALIRNFKE